VHEGHEQVLQGKNDTTSIVLQKLTRSDTPNKTQKGKRKKKSENATNETKHKRVHYGFNRS
jgi:hypothetical protein